jgi:hypothetical protein
MWGCQARGTTRRAQAFQRLSVIALPRRTPLDRRVAATA